MGISSILVLKFAFLPTPSVRRATLVRCKVLQNDG